VEKSCPDAKLHCYSDPTLAVTWAKDHSCDLLITDLLMPKLSGNALIRWFRALPHQRDVPIMVVTVAEDRDRRLTALRAGATDFLNKPVDAIEFEARCRNLLRYRENHLLLSDRAVWLEKRVKQSTAEIEQRELDAMLRLARVGELRENFKGQHVKRIGEYAALVSGELSQPEDYCRLMRYAAPLHDIGKVGIPDAILMKKGPLTADEWTIMQSHTQMGHGLLADSSSPVMQLGAQIALSHHERFDGTGYPAGLAADEIPLAARIVAVVDIFDALLSARAYKPSWPLSKVVQYMKETSGKRLDPDCLRAFFSVLDEALAVRARLADPSDTASLPVRGRRNSC
jgi:two-component system response regulator RpfG